MDTETLKSLLTLLAWVALFVIMMRYGCGAHMVSGHRHRHKDDGRMDEAIRDPVCGMAVNPNSSAGAALREGRTYYFCSSACRDRFEAAPERYLSRSDTAHQAIGSPHD